MLVEIEGTKLLFTNTCHPQSDAQIEVINKTLTSLQRVMVNKRSKHWNVKLFHAEFA